MPVVIQTFGAVASRRVACWCALYSTRRDRGPALRMRLFASQRAERKGGRRDVRDAPLANRATGRSRLCRPKSPSTIAFCPSSILRNFGPPPPCVTATFIAGKLPRLNFVVYSCLSPNAVAMPGSQHRVAYFAVIVVQRWITGPPSRDCVHTAVGPHKWATGAAWAVGEHAGQTLWTAHLHSIVGDVLVSIFFERAYFRRQAVLHFFEFSVA